MLMTCPRCHSQRGTDPDLEHKRPGSQSNAHFCHTLPRSPQAPSDYSLSGPLVPPPPYWSMPRNPDYRQEDLVRAGFLRGRWGNYTLPKGSYFVKLCLLPASKVLSFSRELLSSPPTDQFKQDQKDEEVLGEKNGLERGGQQRFWESPWTLERFYVTDCHLKIASALEPLTQVLHGPLKIMKINLHPCSE